MALAQEENNEIDLAKCLSCSRHPQHALLFEFLAELLQTGRTANHPITSAFKAFTVVQPGCGVDVQARKNGWCVAWGGGPQFVAPKYRYKTTV